MFEAIWFLLIGGLLILMGLARSVIAGLPMTGAMVYLVFGFFIGPAGLGMLNLDIYRDVHVLRLLVETGLLISLFAIGMHLRMPLGSSRWRLVLRLALPAMILTIGIMAAVGFYVLGWTAGIALLAAAALAPTDPVLANELRPREAGDDEPLRFALSGEGGANDGAAYPFVLIGLAVCNLGHPDAQSPWTLAASLAWGVLGALAVGWIMGTATEALVSRLRIRYATAMGYEGFFALGLMSACYGVALLIHGYAFLAVFAAGVALRRKEMHETGDATPSETLEEIPQGDLDAAAQHPALAHAYLAESMMTFSVELEHLAELGLMLVIGAVVSSYWRDMLQWPSLVAVVSLFLVARPLSVWLSLAGTRASAVQRLLAGWLGIRGVGTFFYLLLALEHTDADNIRPIAPVLLAVIVASVFLHGISASPLLERYFRAQDGARASGPEPASQASHAD